MPISSIEQDISTAIDVPLPEPPAFRAMMPGVLPAQFVAPDRLWTGGMPSAAARGYAQEKADWTNQSVNQQNQVNAVLNKMAEADYNNRMEQARFGLAQREMQEREAYRMQREREVAAARLQSQIAASDKQAEVFTRPFGVRANDPNFGMSQSGMKKQYIQKQTELGVDPMTAEAKWEGFIQSHRDKANETIRKEQDDLRQWIGMGAVPLDRSFPEVPPSVGIGPATSEAVSGFGRKMVTQSGEVPPPDWTMVDVGGRTMAVPPQKVEKPEKPKDYSEYAGAIAQLSDQELAMMYRSATMDMMTNPSGALKVMKLIQQVHGGKTISIPYTDQSGNQKTETFTIPRFVGDQPKVPLAGASPVPQPQPQSQPANDLQSAALAELERRRNQGK